jgi:hypothetical protein
MLALDSENLSDVIGEVPQLTGRVAPAQRKSLPSFVGELALRQRSPKEPSDPSDTFTERREQRATEAERCIDYIGGRADALWKFFSKELGVNWRIKTASSPRARTILAASAELLQRTTSVCVMRPRSSRHLIWYFMAHANALEIDRVPVAVGVTQGLCSFLERGAGLLPEPLS